MKRLIAEFEKQTLTQIIFPHPKTDWAEYLLEAQECFVNIIEAVRKYQLCRVVCYSVSEVQKHFESFENLEFVEYEGDDTWARDCSAISVETQDSIEYLDFRFNGWGSKFDAFKDDAMTSNIMSQSKKIDFILEGGSIESNGKGILLTTSECMLNPNRNPHLTQMQITQKLKEYLGVDEVLYLEYGYLAGDDTDSHIDTLVRFISEDELVYVQCKDKDDEHFDALLKMEKQLHAFAQKYNFTLHPLPMVSPLFYDKERLPATYANFLFVNGAVLIPTYNTPEDQEALDIFAKLLPQREIVGIDCGVLVRQHGSLHCVTMNFV